MRLNIVYDLSGQRTKPLYAIIYIYIYLKYKKTLLSAAVLNGVFDLISTTLWANSAKQSFIIPPPIHQFIMPTANSVCVQGGVGVGGGVVHPSIHYYILVSEHLLIDNSCFPRKQIRHFMQNVTNRDNLQTMSIP